MNAWLFILEFTSYNSTENLFLKDFATLQIFLHITGYFVAIPGLDLFLESVLTSKIFMFYEENLEISASICTGI